MRESSADPATRREVPYFLPDIGTEEIDEVAETIRSGWLTTGPRARRFEEDFARYVEAPHALALNSATAALRLAIDALGLGPGDEVLVPTMTFAATANVVADAGARPVLVDCRPDTLNIDPERVEAAITPRTRALLPVHFAGHPCDMDPLHEIARRHGLRVIEDAAHAVPARYRGRRVGSISSLTCFSFYANKTLTTGEGGMLTSDDEDLIRRARIMSGHGINKQPERTPERGAWYYEIEEAGWKFNMSDIAAALGLHQLRRCDALWERRRRCAELYAKGFADVPELTLPHVAADVQHAWHLFVVRLDLEQVALTRQQFIEKLEAAGVGTGVHYIPLHLHPYHRRAWGARPEDCPVASAAAERIVSLPIYSRLTDADVEHVIDVVRDLATQHRR